MNGKRWRSRRHAATRASRVRRLRCSRASRLRRPSQRIARDEGRAATIAVAAASVGAGRGSGSPQAGADTAPRGRRETRTTRAPRPLARSRSHGRSGVGAALARRPGGGPSWGRRPSASSGGGPRRAVVAIPRPRRRTPSMSAAGSRVLEPPRRPFGSTSVDALTSGPQCWPLRWWSEARQRCGLRPQRRSSSRAVRIGPIAAERREPRP